MERFRMVAGIDFSETSGWALERAFSEASARDGAEVHLAAVLEDERSELVEPSDRKRSLVDASDHVRERLSAYGANARVAFHERFPDARPFPLVAHVRIGPIAEGLAALAGEIEADLIIVGTHGRRGVQRLTMGSVAERVVRIAPCPVLVMRPKDRHFFDGVPRPYPACPSCLDARERTGGAQWWCDAHLIAPEPAHTFSHSRRLDDPPVPYAGR